MIPGFPQVGGLELLILLIIILLFFGARRVPELARSLGRGKQEFRKGVEEAETEAQAEKAQPQKVPSESVGDKAERAPQPQ